MKKNKNSDKVKEAESKLKSDEMKSSQDALEKYRKLTDKIDTEISELKEDQEAIKKSKI